MTRENSNEAPECPECGAELEMKLESKDNEVRESVTLGKECRKCDYEKSTTMRRKKYSCF